MEDRTFVLLEKMYSEMNKRFDSMQEDIQQVKKEVLHVGNQITSLEHEASIKFTSLFDSYKQTYEKLHEHDKRFDDIEAKVDNLSLKLSSHDSKLEVLEGGRKK